MNPNLTFHHTGIAVDSIDEALVSYRALVSADKISEIYIVSSQKVRVCFIETAPGVFLELVEPLTEESSIFRLRKKGISFYHIAFTTPVLEASVKQLEDASYKPMEYFHSEAFHGKRCIFLFSPDAHLIELIEQ